MWCGSVVGQVQRTRASTESARVMSFPLGPSKMGQRGNVVLAKTPRMQPSKHVHSILVRFALVFFSSSSLCSCLSTFLWPFCLSVLNAELLFPPARAQGHRSRCHCRHCRHCRAHRAGTYVVRKWRASAAEALVREIVKRPLHASCRIAFGWRRFASRRSLD